MRAANPPLLAILAAALALSACGENVVPLDASSDVAVAQDSMATDAASPADATTLDDASDVPGFADASLADGRVVRGPYATRVVTFEPGEGAGFGRAQLPDIVSGPPVGGGEVQGSTDVVSLGRGGRICVAFDDVTIVDGPGTDFIVFENAFTQVGTTMMWIELGEVSVSEDGTTFHTFECTRTGPPHPGCAGWHAVYSRPNNDIPSDDPARAGGDAFDLATVGLARARFVCVRDLSTQDLAPPSSGFDLDAISAVHFERN